MSELGNDAANSVVNVGARAVGGSVSLASKLLKNILLSIAGIVKFILQRRDQALYNRKLRAEIKSLTLKTELANAKKFEQQNRRPEIDDELRASMEEDARRLNVIENRILRQSEVGRDAFIRENVSEARNIIQNSRGLVDVKLLRQANVPLTCFTLTLNDQQFGEFNYFAKKSGLVFASLSNTDVKQVYGAAQRTHVMYVKEADVPAVKNITEEIKQNAKLKALDKEIDAIQSQPLLTPADIKKLKELEKVRCSVQVGGESRGGDMRKNTLSKWNENIEKKSAVNKAESAAIKPIPKYTGRAAEFVHESR